MNDLNNLFVNLCINVKYINGNVTINWSMPYVYWVVYFDSHAQFEKLRTDIYENTNIVPDGDIDDALNDALVIKAINIDDESRFTMFWYRHTN
jgi:hypothetical protein